MEKKKNRKIQENTEKCENGKKLGKQENGGKYECREKIRKQE